MHWETKNFRYLIFWPYLLHRDGIDSDPQYVPSMLVDTFSPKGDTLYLFLFKKILFIYF